MNSFGALLFHLDGNPRCGSGGMIDRLSGVDGNAESPFAASADLVVSDLGDTLTTATSVADEIDT